jgi:hypothetical protein
MSIINLSTEIQIKENIFLVWNKIKKGKKYYKS